jgi:hypothetical protein
VRSRVQQTEDGVHRSPRQILGERGPDVPDDPDPFLDVGPLDPADLPALRLRHMVQFALVDRDERGAVQGERGVPGDESVKGGVGVGGGRDTAGSLVVQPVADVEQHLRQDRVLAAEVPVEGGSREAHGRAEVSDGHSSESAHGKEFRSGRQDLRAPVLGISPCWGLGHGPSLDDRVNDD